MHTVHFTACKPPAEYKFDYMPYFRKST